MHLRISAGHLPPGAEILVRTMEGDVLGGVSPFGARQRAGPATYSIPVPESAVRDGRLELRLEVLQPGAPTRPPTASELGVVHFEFVPTSN